MDLRLILSEAPLNRACEAWVACVRVQSITTGEREAGSEEVEVGFSNAGANVWLYTT
jgi:hypothetical protein